MAGLRAAKDPLSCLTCVIEFAQHGFQPCRGIGPDMGCLEALGPEGEGEGGELFGFLEVEGLCFDFAEGGGEAQVSRLILKRRRRPVGCRAFFVSALAERAGNGNPSSPKPAAPGIYFASLRPWSM